MPLPGYAKADDMVFIRTYLADYRCRGLKRDFVFTGLAAEKDGDGWSAHKHSPFWSCGAPVRRRAGWTAAGLAFQKNRSCPGCCYSTGERKKRNVHPGEISLRFSCEIVNEERPLREGFSVWEGQYEEGLTAAVQDG